MQQAVERALHLALGEVHHRLAVALLVAGVDQRVEGQRVLVGSGGLLLDEAGEQSGFERSQVGGHGSRHRRRGEHCGRAQGAGPRIPEKLHERVRNAGRHHPGVGLRFFDERKVYFKHRVANPENEPVECDGVEEGVVEFIGRVSDVKSKKANLAHHP